MFSALLDSTTVKRSSASMALMIAPLAAVLLSQPTVAHAQPNPFDAYEGKKQAEQTPVAPTQQAQTTANAQATTPCNCSETLLLRYNQTGQGQLVFDVRSAFATTFTSNDTPDSGTVQNSTFFARLSPGVGYFIRPDIEIGGSAGVMWRRIARDGDTAATSRELLLEARGRYHYHLTQRFTLIPGLTLGGYTGTSTRPTSVSDDANARIVTERTRTYGLAATLNLDTGYVINDRVALNAGLGVIGLFGGERIEALDERFRVTTVNASLNLGLVYAF